MFRNRTTSCRVLALFIALMVISPVIAELNLAVRADGTWGAVPDLSAAPTPVVRHHDDLGLSLSVGLSGITLTEYETPAGVFTYAGWRGAAVAGAFGDPTVPVVRKLFYVPAGAEVRWSARVGRRTEIGLGEMGFSNPLIPMQPPISKAPGALERSVFHFNREAFARDGFAPEQPVAIRELGIARGQRLFLLEVRPVAYNPAGGVLRLTSEMDVELEFVGGGSFDDSLTPLPGLNAAVLNPLEQNRARRTGNLLLIVPEEYQQTGPINQYIAAKTDQGLNVMLYEPPEGTTKEQVRAEILSYYQSATPPDYVLLVGDTNWMPYWEGGGVKHSVTDLPYVCMDGSGDWYPDIALGRFSVRSLAELQTLVDKTLYVEAGSFEDPYYVKRATFMAGTDGASGDEETHDWVIDTYLTPNGYTSNKVYARTYGAGTEDTRAAYNTGCMFGVYFGHSWGDAWQNGPHFDQDDVRGLTNENMYGLNISFTCTIGNYQRLECFNETWVRVADRGAAAMIGATTYIYYTTPPWHETTFLEHSYFTGVYGHELTEVSPAWQYGLYELLAHYGPDHDAVRDYFEMFNLLGDPSLDLPMHVAPTFDLSAQPVHEAICGGEDAVYGITVEQILGYEEVVTLDVSGLPAGATAAFSVNDQVPPFTSTLTISDTDGAAGPYELLVTGVSVDYERDVALTLDVSGAMPGDVQLASPPDGATEIFRQPTLSWSLLPEALEYDLQVATDSGFNDIIYAHTTGETSHTVTVYLNTLTEYFWRVRAVNGCGVGVFSAPFSFITADQTDYFTEEFTGGGSSFDLDGFAVTFTPDGLADYYSFCGEVINGLPVDPGGGTVLELGDDVSAQIYPSLPLALYGHGYDSVYVNSNGNLTFGSGDTTYSESLDRHFDRPRISALFDDLNPNAGGTISWKTLSDRTVVTFEDVPEYSNEGSNTFQFELFDDGTIRISWFGVTAADAIAGLSEGNGVPGDLELMDLSAAPLCEEPQDGFVLLVSPETVSVCAPNTAVYSIEVEPVLGFSEAVTLSTKGLPASADVSFSENGQVPPFTSTLTIGNTEGILPETYPFELEGLADTAVNAVDLEMIVVHMPGQVTLLAPADGSVEVARNPLLAWETSTYADTYELEIALDAGFGDVVYEAYVTETEHVVSDSLDMGVTHYWHVRAANACGTGDYSPTFSFTTADQLDYFTEQFADGDTFDLEGLSVMFTPAACADLYEVCAEPATAFPVDPEGGAVLSLGDDDSVEIMLSKPVLLYNLEYESFFVNSNGNLTFGVGDTTYNETLGVHFGEPRISMLFDDLNPNSGGTISWKVVDGKYAVTFEDVPQYGAGDQNSFQAELFFDGRIRVTWLEVGTPDAIAGLSAGVGLPDDFVETDLSAAGGCMLTGDMNCDGVVNNFDIDPFVMALTDPAGYEVLYPDCDLMAGDVNGDGAVNNFDIDPFVSLLTGI